jgi:hypothetical protein
MPTCAGCLIRIADRRYLNCCNCQKSYDLLCANVPTEAYNAMRPEHKSSWKCVQCKSVEPRSDNTNTPVRGGSANVTVYRGAALPRTEMSPENPGDSSVMDVSYTDSQQQQHNNNTTLDTTLDPARVSEVQLLVTELRLFREEMRTMSQQIHALRGAISSLTSRIDSCDGRIDMLCARVEALESKPDTRAENVLEPALVETIAQLRLELNDRDQDVLLNDIEISGVPEQSGENTVHIVTTLGQKLGVSLTEHDIVQAARVGRKLQLDEGVQGPATRPRLLVVRLARRAVRDQMLQAARVRRGATTEGTGLPSTPCRFYVNERLTQSNRQLFQKVRVLKEQHSWRYAWTRDGRIFVRQRSGENVPRHRIRTELDLARVFGSVSI